MQGEAALVLKLLAKKGLSVSVEQHKKIEACQDLAQLEMWAERILTAQKIEDVLGAPTT